MEYPVQKKWYRSVVREIPEKTYEYNIDNHRFFIDFQRDFDTKFIKMNSMMLGKVFYKAIYYYADISTSH